MSMWELIVKHKTPPTRRMRYCCEEFKGVFRCWEKGDNRRKEVREQEPEAESGVRHPYKTRSYSKKTDR